MSYDAFALQSLFRAASETRRREDLDYKVRISFPAELWFFYNRLSINPLKDFDNSMLLHWSGGEILQLAAQRLETFLDLRYPDLLKSSSGDGIPRSPARYAQFVLGRFLPQNVTNSVGLP